MMWLASLLILISAGGSYGNDFDCYFREGGKCHEATQLPNKFPKTSEELLRGCRRFAEITSCLADAGERCNYYDEKRIAADRHKVRYMNTVCHEDTPVFEAISNNLDCIEKMDMSMMAHCSGDFSESTKDAIMERFQPLIDNKRNDLLDCAYYWMYLECRSLQFARQCGEDVGEAVAEVILNLKGSENVCPPGVLEETYSLFEGLEDVIREEMALWNKKRK